MRVDAAQTFLWFVLPYLAVVVFVLGHIWRYRRDQLGWTSRSTQLLEGRALRVGSLLFHFGALAVIGGHVLGILVPASATAAIGIDEHAYHLISAVAGTIAGGSAVVGLLVLIVRRGVFARIRRRTSAVDLAVYALLALVIGLGMAETLFHNLLASGNGYNYRSSVSIWYRGLFALEDHAALMAHAPLVYRLHVLAAWAIIALWPFSRLVHAWSIPLQYLGRPYILYRRRFRPARRRFPASAAEGYAGARALAASSDMAGAAADGTGVRPVVR